MVAARGSDASVAGGGVRTSQTPPTHTMTVATEAAASRPIPNHSTHARARSDSERGAAGLSKDSTIDLLDQWARHVQHHQEGVGRGEGTDCSPNLPGAMSEVTTCGHFAHRLGSVG